MTNNDILRRVRYAFDFDDSKMMAFFGLADHQVTRAQISAWLKKDDDPGFQKCTGTQLAVFLDGMIIANRGKREGSDLHINNNIIFKKLRIALDLRSEDILEIMELAGMHLSKHELSAFFRKTDHKHYRDCKDQVLRKFLQGIQLKYRAAAPENRD